MEGNHKFIVHKSWYRSKSVMFPSYSAESFSESLANKAISFRITIEAYG